MSDPKPKSKKKTKAKPVAQETPPPAPPAQETIPPPHEAEVSLPPLEPWGLQSGTRLMLAEHTPVPASYRDDMPPPGSAGGQLPTLDDTPSFHCGPDGPTMGPMLAREPSFGQQILEEITSATLTNTLDQDKVKDLAKLVETWQSRLDLAGVGMTAYAMSRVQSTTGFIENIETHLMERMAQMPVGMAMQFLQILQRDRLAYVSLLGEKASRPSISSPDALSGSLAGVEHAANKPKISFLKPESRKKLSTMLCRMRRVVDVESRVVSQGEESP